MKRFFALILAVAMLCSSLPLSAFALNVDVNLDTTECGYYNIIEKTDYNLAPGAVESEIVLDNDDGSRRQVVHVIEVDPNNDNISVMPTFKNIDHGVDYTDEANWGVMEMTKQAAYVEENLGKNVVGAMNVCLSWAFYHPYGLLIYEGEVLMDTRSSCDICGNSGHPGGGYLVIYKDGKAEIREPNAPLTGDEWMAQTICFNVLVKDGKNVYASETHSGDDAPRSVIGVKADGTLVLMMCDGRMAPYAAGFTSHEMAEMMISLGCVDAVNCDGGGSSTFITEREGTGELSVKSRFSDGAERATLTGIAVISKAVADGKFDHAAISADNKLVTPGSSVTFTATGADSAGGPADVPEDVSWQLADSSMGTITDGVFVSNGKTGTVTAQMVYGGKVVGEADIDVVIPDSLSFVMSNITAPYTKTVPLEVVAKYGYTEVALKADDVKFTLSDDALGTISGNKLTATDDTSVKSGSVTASLVCNESLQATANIVLGRASSVVYDFESGADSIAKLSVGGWKEATYPFASNYLSTSISVVSAEDGKVKNGNYAMQWKFRSNSSTLYGWAAAKLVGLGIDLTDAVSLSFWMYIPEGSHGYELDIGSAIPVGLGHEFAYGTGWQYITVPVSSIGKNVKSLDSMALYVSDNKNAAINYNPAEHPNYYADIVYYIDDITVDYSTAVEDNQAPIISNPSVSYDGIDSVVALNGQTLTNNVISVSANAADNTKNTNYTGIDVNSAAVYVDGVKVDTMCNESGLISTGNISLANGVHRFRFEICDNNGNVGYTERLVVIAAEDNTKDTITFESADKTLTNVPLDSLIWKNLTADALENVKSVSVIVDLDNLSKWELEHMVVADGFKAVYSVDDESNDATITITRVGESATGAGVLVSLPIRVWTYEFAVGEEDIQLSKIVSVISFIEMGVLTTVDGNVSTFSSDEQVISTEENLWRLSQTSQPNQQWHTHIIAPVADKAATCTEDGYIGRTICVGCECAALIEAAGKSDFCEGCDHDENGCGSIVDWGTTIPATGHTYEIIDGKYACACGDVNAMTGLIKDGDVYRYIYMGTVRSGWFAINDEWYYFSSSTMAAVSGRNKVDGIYFDFEENGKLISGTWAKNMTGTRYYYGPSYYYRGWYNIDGIDYYFKNGYLCTGIDFQKGSGMTDIWYDFGPDGASATKLNGVFDVDGSLRYFEEGVATEKYLVKVGNDYYYATYNGYVAIDKTINAIATNCDLPKGTYTFGADGKMIGSAADGEIVEFGGVLYYYVSGKGVEAGLICVDGDYYYAAYKGQLVINKAVNVRLTSCDLPTGTYEFGADGKVLNGIVDKDGVLYYYENGQGVEKGLFLYEGDYYYSAYKGQLVVNKSLNISNTNCELLAGRYEFGTDGKMLNGIVDKDGVLYYYENGQGVEKGLVCVDGEYYYSAYKGQLVVNKTLNVPITNCDMPKDRYEFGADGKMIGSDKDGEIVDKDGVLYYYVSGKGVEAGLVCVDGEYYYAAYKGQLVINKILSVPMTNCDMPKDRYEFGANGEMIGSAANGEIVDKDGVLYYYKGGKGVEAGLVCVDGAYYYATYQGKLAVGKVINTSITSCDLPNGRYEFGADGKMLNGIVEKDGVLYYYENGQGVEAGLICVDGAYYYAAYKGQIVVNKVLSASITNCDLPAGRYEFGADGKMLDGIVEKDGILYYYENGVGVEKGLFFYEGYYYYAAYKGQLVTNRDFNVKNANGLLIEQVYTFNELGQIIA